MKKFNKKKGLISLVMALMPVLSCVFLAAIQKMFLWEIYVPNSKFNDEIMYFKQIAGAVEYGFPQGYFGYNESFADSLTYSAWSPVIIYPYIFIAKFLGIRYATPIVTNILFLSTSFLLFALIYEPEWKDVLSIGGITILFIPLSRLQLSIMSDVEIIALCIIYLGIFMSCEKTKEKGNNIPIMKIVFLFIISVILTLMRPYFLLFFVFPGIYLFKKNKSSIIVSILICLSSVTLYFWISGKFTAAYFVPLIRTDWINNILSNPISGLRMAASIFFYGCLDILKYFTTSPFDGQMSGAIWVLFVLLSIVIFVKAFKNHSYWIWIIMVVSITGAIIMFYDLHTGSRHLLSFVLMLMIMIALDASRVKYMPVLIMVAVLFLFTTRVYQDSYNYLLPTYDSELDNDIESISLKCNDMISETGTYWDNTMIWVWSDGNETIRWNEFYALPNGIGINMCEASYVIDNFCQLQSRYIASIPSGDVAELCKGFPVVAATDDICIWKLK